MHFFRILLDDEGEDAAPGTLLPAVQEELCDLAEVPPRLPPGHVRDLLTAAGAAATGQEVVRLETTGRSHVFAPAGAVGEKKRQQSRARRSAERVPKDGASVVFVFVLCCAVLCCVVSRRVVLCG